MVGVKNVCACKFSIRKQKFTVKLSDGVKASSYRKGTSDFKESLTADIESNSIGR